MKVDLLENYTTRYTAEDYPLAKVLKPLKLNWESGPWLAGGFLRRLVMNELVSTGDIDVYFAYGRQLENIIVKLGGDVKARDKHRYRNSYIYEYEGVKYNLIFKKFYRDPVAVIEDFDFTVCQFISDGVTLGVGEHTLEHCADRALVVAPKTDFPQMQRIIKYLAKGFHPWTDKRVTDDYFEIVREMQRSVKRGVTAEKLQTELGLRIEEIVY